MEVYVIVNDAIIQKKLCVRYCSNVMDFKLFEINLFEMKYNFKL